MSSPGLSSTSIPRLMTLALPCWITIECHPLDITSTSVAPSALATQGTVSASKQRLGRAVTITSF
jgi:hypothetical protein